ncbi:GT4 family glycosyltransferase PelF [Pilimelia columellifera]|uniref:GT4 family glycosyltransferase PelF n=1 Tax=Pilimelia columellifera subsp. columellifera TaxID=706583 RepID=A0ABN3N4D9_9ACTN
MRIALINEGTYPLAHGGVSTWCHQLVSGLTGHTFTLVALSGLAASGKLAYDLPGNVSTVRNVAVWDRPAPARGMLARRRRRRAAAEAAAGLLWGMFTEGPAGVDAFGAALRQLAVLSDDGAHPLHDVPLAGPLRHAWRSARLTQQDIRLPLPGLSRQEAMDAGMLLEHALRPLAHQLGQVDVCHAVAAGLPLLVALAAKWRDGVPYLITEHGVYLRERYLERNPAVTPAVKTIMLRFYRALAKIGYAEAGLVTSVSRFNQRWERRLGAPATRTMVVPNGVSPDRYPPLTATPQTPTIVWVGRIDPLKDLHTLVRAFALVRRSVPTAQLRLVGPVPSTNQPYADSCHALVGSLGLGGSVTFCGPVASSREAYAAGHVVALSSISEGMPYTVVEAMMCGRATVSTDVGGVADTVGDAGLVCAPGDPAAFAAACVTLLTDHARRDAIGAAARARALENFSLSRMLDTYDALYTEVRLGVGGRLAEPAPIPARALPARHGATTRPVAGSQPVSGPQPLNVGPSIRSRTMARMPRQVRRQPVETDAAALSGRR